jgi:hypothetical protein
MIGAILHAVPSAMSGVGGVLSDGPLIMVLVTQATCCMAAGLAAGYLWHRRAARAHQALFLGLLMSVAMPMSYLLVRHMELGVLTPQVTVSSHQQSELPTTEPVSAGHLSLSEVPASDTEGVDAESEDADLFAESPAWDPTEPSFLEEARPAPVAGAGTPWPAVFFGGSLVTGLALWGRLLWRFVLGQRLVHRAQDVDAKDLCAALEEARTRMNVTGPVQLRSSPKVRSPLIWCWRRVPVLLVHRQTSLRPPHCDWVGIFCHELAHWKRLDHVTGLFCELLLCAAPWHPLLWWARGRLAVLSEEACDDWVVAEGRAGVDYAESLLGLSPQAQMAFLPTVVGKEKAMKERICRILKDRCGNPRAGTRWAVLVAAAAIGTSVTVALAQPGPPARAGIDGPANPAEVGRPKQPPQGPRQERPLLIAGRRNVLNRMLENLHAQQREAEARLQEQGDIPNKDAVVLRSELAAIRNHIDMLERQLQNLDQPQPLKPTGPGGPIRNVEQPPVREQRLLRLQSRIDEADAKLKKLEDNGKGDSEQARQVRENLLQAREELAATREGPRPEPVTQPGPARPQAQLQERVQQLQDQVNNLNRKMEQLQRTLDQLVQQRSGEPTR